MSSLPEYFPPVPRPWPDGADLGDRTRILLARYENDSRTPGDAREFLADGKANAYAAWFAELLDEWQETYAGVIP